MSKREFTIYLAGPISGCNSKQRKEWRNDFKNLFGREFQWEDPTEWGEDWAPHRETLAIARCDIVVANMWKESIGTTIGIFHACREGKPVILIDPNYIENKILLGIIPSDLCARKLRDAHDIVMRILNSISREVSVENRNGARVPFSKQKLISSIKKACLAAGCDDTILPTQVVGQQVLDALRRSEGREPVIRTGEIKDTVYRVLDRISNNPIYPREVRDASTALKDSWSKREEYKSVERLFDEAVERAERLEGENKRLKENMQALVEAQAAREPLQTPSGPAGDVDVPKSSILRGARIKLSAVEHHLPRKIDETLNNLADLDFVCEIRTERLVNSAHCRTTGHYDPGEPGLILAQYSDGSKGIVLRVGTSARDTSEWEKARREIDSVLIRSKTTAALK